MSDQLVSDQSAVPGLSSGVSVMGIVIGAFALLVGLTITAVKAYRFSSMQKTSGVAVDYERGVDGMSGAWPHVQYRVGDRDYVVSGSVHSESGDRTGINKGDTVDVFYWKEDPGNAQVGTFREMWFTSVLVCLVGSGFLAIGLLLSLGSRFRS